MIKEKVTEIVKPILEEMNVSLYDVEFEKLGLDYFLRIFIDSEHGVDLDLCVAVTEKLDPILDEADVIDHEYYLEVASPGAERTLKTRDQVVGAVGKYVNAKVHEAIDGIKEFEGLLEGFEEDVLTIKVNLKGRMKNYSVPYDKIAKIRLAIKF